LETQASSPFNNSWAHKVPLFLKCPAAGTLHTVGTQQQDISETTAHVGRGRDGGLRALRAQVERAGVRIQTLHGPTPSTSSPGLISTWKVPRLDVASLMCEL
jgi:hypothetical protein